MPDEALTTADSEENTVESAEDQRFRELSEKNLEHYTLADWGFMARFVGVMIGSRVLERLFERSVHRLPWWYQLLLWVVVAGAFAIYEVRKQWLSAPPQSRGRYEWRDVIPLLAIAAALGTIGWALSLLWDRLHQIDWLMAVLGGLAICGILVLSLWWLGNSRHRWRNGPE